VAAFPFQSILLHTLPGGQGWQIIAIKHDRTRELVATLTPAAGEWLAQRWADLAAKNLTGLPAADQD
jgi:hypothetical protein